MTKTEWFKSLVLYSLIFLLVLAINAVYAKTRGASLLSTEFVAVHVLLYMNAISVALLDYLAAKDGHAILFGLLVKGVKTMVLLAIAVVLRTLEWPTYETIFIPCFLIGFLIVMIVDVIDLYKKFEKK